MTKKDLKVGMVVELTDFEGTKMAMVCELDDSTICLSGEKCYIPIDKLTNDLRYGDFGATLSINKVYGLADGAKYASKISNVSRKLLWERDHEPKVGDVYECSTGKFTLVSVRSEVVHRLWDDGSCGAVSIDYLKDNHTFTGKNIGHLVSNIMKAI